MVSLWWKLFGSIGIERRGQAFRVVTAFFKDTELFEDVPPISGCTFGSRTVFEWHIVL